MHETKLVDGLVGSIVNLVSSIVQNEALQAWIDLEELRKNIVSVMEKAKNLLLSSEDFFLTGVDIVIGFVDLLATETIVTKKVFCQHLKGKHKTMALL